MEAAGLARPIAKEFIRNVLFQSGTDSVLSVYRRDVTIKDTRSRREINVLAGIIDLLRARDYRSALEMCVRRLAGVHTADASGNWRMCDAFEMHTETRSFVPERFLKRALSTVVQLQAVEKAAGRTHNKGSSAASRKGGGGADYKKGGGGAGSASGGGGDYPKREHTGAGSSSSHGSGSKGAGSKKK